MRKLIFLLIIPVSIQAIAQECNIEAQIQNDYLNDAKILALREIYSDTTSNYVDSVEIPLSLMNKYLGVLSVIYSIDNEVVDTIFNGYNIHVFPDVPYMAIRMYVDTNYTWIRNFLVDSVSSGNAQFDSLIMKYDFKLESYANYSFGTSVQITTPKYLNLGPIVDSLEKIQGLYQVYAMSWSGDGANIDYLTSNDTTYISFSIGWGDCLAGCMHRQYWNFSIYDCIGTYLGTSGDTYTSINRLSNAKYNFYPNPVNDVLIVENWNEINRIDIYDLQGKLIIAFDKVFNKLDLTELTTGHYLLKIQNNNNEELTTRIIKR